LIGTSEDACAIVGAANKGIEAWKDRNNNEENK